MRGREGRGVLQKGLGRRCTGLEMNPWSARTVSDSDCARGFFLSSARDVCITALLMPFGMKCTCAGPKTKTVTWGYLERRPLFGSGSGRSSDGGSPLRNLRSFLLSLISVFVSLCFPRHLVMSCRFSAFPSVCVILSVCLRGCLFCPVVHVPLCVSVSVWCAVLCCCPCLGNPHAHHDIIASGIEIDHCDFQYGESEKLFLSYSGISISVRVRDPRTRR